MDDINANRVKKLECYIATLQTLMQNQFINEDKALNLSKLNAVIRKLYEEKNEIFINVLQKSMPMVSNTNFYLSNKNEIYIITYGND